MKGYCKDCAAWEPTVGVTYGRCHRTPPCVVVLHEGNDWQHPLRLSTDWCLDHTPRERNSPDKANNDPIDGDNSAEVAK